jgi:hypothetical protein
LSCFNIFFLIEIYKRTAIIHHNRSEIIHEATISQIFHRLTISNHAEVTHAQIKPHIIEFVVDTGALR